MQSQARVKPESSQSQARVKPESSQSQSKSRLIKSHTLRPGLTGAGSLQPDDTDPPA